MPLSSEASHLKSASRKQTLDYKSLEGLMLKLKLQSFVHLMGRTDSLEKTLMLVKLKVAGEGDDRGWDKFEQALGVGDEQGGVACCGLWGCKESDTTEWLNWNDWLINHSSQEAQRENINFSNESLNHFPHSLWRMEPRASCIPTDCPLYQCMEKKALGSIGKLGFKRIWINFTNTVCASMLSFCYWLALNLRVIKVVVVQLWSRVLSFATPWTAAHHTPPSMGFPGKNTGVGSHFLLQGIFPTQGLNPCHLHRQADSLPLSQQWSPIKVVRAA